MQESVLFSSYSHLPSAAPFSDARSGKPIVLFVCREEREKREREKEKEGEWKRKGKDMKREIEMDREREENPKRKKQEENKPHLGSRQQQVRNPSRPSQP
jgi:hypothetical protein